MALFVVLSVFSGLRNFSLGFTNSTDPAIKMEAKMGKTFLVNAQEEAQLNSSTFIKFYSKTCEERVLFYYNDKEHVAYLKGVDSLYTKLNTFSTKLYTGNWLETNSNQAVIGSEISRKLSLGLLDFNNALEVFSPKPGKGMIDNPEDAFSKKMLQPSGIYNINEDVDNKYVFCDIKIAQKLLQYKPNEYSSIEFEKFANVTDNEAIAALKKIFKNKGIFKTRMQLNDSLYKMLNTENIAVYLIFTLVIIIALFNLIGALIMIIIDKKGNLKTLYNIGTPMHKLRKIFLFQGALLTVVGGTIGTLLGVVVILIQQEYEIVRITPSLAYPVIFEIKNILIVTATIFSLGLMASYIASSSVRKNLIK